MMETRSSWQHRTSLMHLAPLWFLIWFSLTGCGGPPTHGTVVGAVKIDGAPAKNGGITFISRDGTGGTAGAEIVDGAYRAERVPLGPSRVEIHVAKVLGKKKLYDTPDSPMVDVTVEALPPKYHDDSTLELDVQPGENQQDYELSTH